MRPFFKFGQTCTRRAAPLGIEPGLGPRVTRPWAPGNAAQLFPWEKPAWERRGLEPRGLCASEILWNPWNPLKSWKVRTIRLWAPDPGGLRRFFPQKNSDPQNLDLPAWSILAFFGRFFDPKWPNMFRGRDVHGNFGMSMGPWARFVPLISSLVPPYFLLISSLFPPYFPLGPPYFLLISPLFRKDVWINVWKKAPHPGTPNLGPLQWAGTSAAFSWHQIGRDFWVKLGP